MSSPSRILKSETVAEIVAAGQFNYEDLKLRCDHYLDSVRAQARQLLLDAQQQIEQSKKQATEQGHAAGVAQGLQQAEQQIQQRIKKQAEQILQQRLDQLTAPLQQATRQLQQERQECVSRWDNQALELICALVEKLVHKHIELDPAVITDRLHELLQLTIGSSQIRVHLAQTDLDRVGPDLEQLLQTVRQRTQVELVGNAEFQPGDCFIQTESGTLDARITTQLERIVNELGGL